MTDSSTCLGATAPAPITPTHVQGETTPRARQDEPKRVALLSREHSEHHLPGTARDAVAIRPATATRLGER
ncbi:hypothetical protein SGFS_063530 [Streptomyces graminofaciens]|uniref:Uncharacterized protein n=1 Tax=Streptomyces graminofaciens TaxID=68212 RepID=A0ABM7FEX1_9ACTN|nr:hypothetical protein SGFS_063530 [Streptomyces graminofaciens]